MTLYVTAEEAAEMLGIELRTLYTYVGRKGVRTARAPGKRRSLYWRADIENLRKKAGAQVPGADRDKRNKQDSAITLITPLGPFYRGQSAIALAEHATVEETAGILWNIDGAFAGPLPRLSQTYRNIAPLLGDLGTAERALVLLPLAEAANLNAYDLTPEGYARAAAGVIRLLTAILVGAPEPSTEPLHKFIGRALGAEPVYVDLVRRALVLNADHSLESATQSVRTLASVGVTPYSAVLTGLAALRGRKLRMGRADTTLHFIDEIMTSNDPRKPALRRIRDGDFLPGFESVAFPDGDPRAIAMLKACNDTLGSEPEFCKLKAVISVVEEITGKGPDFILFSAFLRFRINAPIDSIPIIAVGRVIGWIAHAIEQFATAEAPPRNIVYTGPLPPT